MQVVERIMSLDDYSSVNLSPMSERLLKITRYYDKFNQLKQEGKVNPKISFIIGLLLEREELYKKVVIQLSKELCLQEYNLLRKNMPFYYASHHKKVKKLTNFLKTIKTIDVILFSEMGGGYIKWLQKEFKPKELVVCEVYKNTLWAVYLWNDNGYYFLSYIYGEGVEGVKNIFKKYYGILQLLMGELCLGYGKLFKKRQYICIKEDWREFISEVYGVCYKHSVGNDLYVYYFKYLEQEGIDKYMELCDFELEEVKYHEIEEYIVSWDEVIGLF